MGGLSPKGGRGDSLGASGVVTFSGASTVGGSRGAAPAVPFGNGDTLDVRLCYKGEGRGVGLVTCWLEA